MKSLIREIHRRSLWQVLIIFIGASWGVLELVDHVVERFGMPEWVYGGALILLLLGLPVVLATAFIQEAPPGAPSPDRVEPEAGVGSVLTWRNALLGGVVAFAVLGVASAGWVVWGPGGGSTEPEGVAARGPAGNSIAVLPFENLSADPDDEYFTDGIHDEILNQLFKISSLQVISRTSVLTYKENPPTGIRAVADQLGVRYVMEGTVRRFGNRVRITAQLIDAATDLHAWSESYDRELTDLLEIQAEVATEIARTLEAELTPEEVARIEARPTNDVDAYDAYLRGLDYTRSGYVAGWDDRAEDWRIAAEMYERAVELDPDFGEARAALAFAHLQLYWYGFDRRPDRAEMARRELDEALRRSPDLAIAHVNEGYYHYWVERDYDRAIARFERGLEGLPGDAEVRSLIGFVYRRQGRLDRAVERIEEAFRRDPLNGNLAEELGNTLRGNRQWDEGLRYLDRAIALAPDYPEGHARRIDLLVSRTGRTDEAWRAYRAAERLVPVRDLLTTAVWLETLDRNWDGALRRIDADHPGEPLFMQYDVHPAALLRARVLDLAGRSADAGVQYAAARTALEAMVRETPEDYRVHRALARAYAGLGLPDRALASIATAKGGVPLELDRWTAPDLIEDEAWILMRAGRPDDAVDRLRFLLENRSRNRVTGPLLRVSPLWDPLRGHPGFEQLLRDFPA